MLFVNRLKLLWAGLMLEAAVMGVAEFVAVDAVVAVAAEVVVLQLKNQKKAMAFLEYVYFEKQLASLQSLFLHYLIFRSPHFCFLNLQIYDPTYQHYTMIIPSDPGTPGDAKPMGDDVVGILTNGVLLDSHQQTFAYDSCNGHSDKKHQYHYHIPPICLLQEMGVAFADSHTWWINDLGNETRPWEDMAAQFPETSPSSPVLGFARDGFPIFGPYDDAGNLQRGASFGGDLDECNGKIDSNGNYGYYFTVDPPFAPVCLRGEIGNFAYSSTNIKCPKEGISNDILVDMDADMDMNTTTAVGKTTEDIDVDDEKAAEADREDLFLGSGATSMTASFTFALMAALLFV